MIPSDGSSHGEARERHGEPCQRCNERFADGWHEGEVSILGFALRQPWCERCLVEERLRQARKAAQTIAELEKKLSALGGPHALSNNFWGCYACGIHMAMPAGADKPYGWIRTDKGLACCDECAASPPMCSYTHAIGKSGMWRFCAKTGEDVTLNDGFWRCPEHTKKARSR